MRPNHLFVAAAVLTLAFGATACATRTEAVADASGAPAKVKKPRQDRGLGADPMAPLDNPAVSQVTCRGRSAVC